MWNSCQKISNLLETCRNRSPGWARSSLTPAPVSPSFSKILDFFPRTTNNPWFFTPWVKSNLKFFRINFFSFFFLFLVRWNKESLFLVRWNKESLFLVRWPFYNSCKKHRFITPHTVVKTYGFLSGKFLKTLPEFWPH